VNIKGSMHSAARELRNRMQLLLKRPPHIVVARKIIAVSRKCKKPRCGTQARPSNCSAKPPPDAATLPHTIL
jgi:hypothetical protein